MAKSDAERLWEANLEALGVFSGGWISDYLCQVGTALIHIDHGEAVPDSCWQRLDEAIESQKRLNGEGA